jgi:hypothetical protein
MVFRKCPKVHTSHGGGGKIYNNAEVSFQFVH